MNARDLPALGVAELQALLRAREVSPGEVVEALEARITAKDSPIGAYLSRDLEAARKLAANADVNLSLGGVPIAIKDNINVAGQPCTCASEMLRGYRSPYDATVIQKLVAAGAIPFGKTNLDEFAMGSSTEHSAFQTTRNPWDTTRVAGGSSGGSAAAVAAGQAFAALGTDTGGSVRQPAAFCGVVGLKPTYSRISRYGLVAFASSFDQIGPLTRSVEDAALLLEIMAGPDGMDSTASQREVPAYSQLLAPAGHYRIGYIADAIDNEGLNPEIKAALEGQLDRLRGLGHVVEPVDFHYLDVMIPTYYILTTAEASSNLSRFDGVKYGYRAPDVTDLESLYKKSRSQGFGTEVQRRIILGTFVLSANYYDAYYTKAQRVRRLIKEKTDELLRQYDFLVLPTTPTTAFRIGEKQDPVSMYLADIFTVQASLAGVPAISVPMGDDAEGMPMGLQVMAGAFREAELLAFATELVPVEAEA